MNVAGLLSQAGSTETPPMVTWGLWLLNSPTALLTLLQACLVGPSLLVKKPIVATLPGLGAHPLAAGTLGNGARAGDSN